jgi:hypothetical protein
VSQILCWEGSYVPSPRESSTLSARELLRDVESETSTSRRRTVTFVGLNDLESAVLGRLLVHADRNLARSSAMDGRAIEAEKDRLVDRDLVHRRDLVAARFAWVVRSVSLQGRVVEGGNIERHRGGHLHVCIRESEESEGENALEAEVEKHGGARDGKDGSCCWNDRASGAECRRTRPASRFLMLLRCCVNVSNSCGLLKNVVTARQAK